MQHETPADGILVTVSWNGNETWDFLCDFDATPVRAPGGGFHCTLCREDARKTHRTRFDLWREEIFELLKLGEHRSRACPQDQCFRMAWIDIGLVGER